MPSLLSKGVECRHVCHDDVGHVLTRLYDTYVRVSWGLALARYVKTLRTKALPRTGSRNLERSDGAIVALEEALSTRALAARRDLIRSDFNAT